MLFNKVLQVVLFWICYQVLAQVDIFRWKICWKNPLANFYRSVTKGKEGLIKTIAEIFPSKSIRLLRLSSISWQISAKKYHHFVAIFYAK